ncbi:hypothetical protein LBMAG42_19880 [Deltaproteobacteria bacterium]|nr:hypothetical protein LBMAG42_19880 [Deltaproteobacteria bacterium]
MIALLLAALLAGCTGFDFKDAAEGGTPEDPAIAPGTLRIDMRPASDALELLPQSFLLAPGTYEDVQVAHELSASSTIFGTFNAESMQGLGAAAASASGPLDAVIRAGRAGLLQGGAANTDEEGSVSFTVPGNQAYSVEIIPNDASRSPMIVLGNATVDGDLDLSQTVEAGAPVYGRVTDAAGVRLADTELRLRRTDLDVSSATFTTDKNGWFIARVEPGYEYALATVGDGDAVGGPIASVEQVFTVEGADGAEVNLDVGERDSFVLSARAVDAGGDPIPNPHVRATSTSLETGSLVLEFEAQSDGKITLELLPGTWTIEVWPSTEQAELTPWVATFTVTVSDDVDDSDDIGDITLNPPTRLSGTVTRPNGEGAEGVSVTAREVGFGGYSFNTTTDADGNYTLDVPRSPLRVQAIPAIAASGAYTNQAFDLTEADSTEAFDIPLVTGALLSGVATLNGEPVPFALVEIYDHAEELLLARTLTDADGAYTVRIDLPESEADLEGAEDSGDDTGDDTGGDTGGDTGP